MVDQLKSIFYDQGTFDAISDLHTNQNAISLSGISGSAGAFFLSSLNQNAGGRVVCVVESESRAKQLYEDLCELVGEERVVYYPPLGHQLWSEIGPSRTEVGRRIFALNALSNENVLFLILRSPFRRIHFGFEVSGFAIKRLPSGNRESQ